MVIDYIKEVGFFVQMGHHEYKVNTYSYIGRYIYCNIMLLKRATLVRLNNARARSRWR